MNAEMDRWVFASVGKHFNSKKGNYHLHIDGQQRQTEGKKQWTELKVLGPVPTTRSNNDIRYDLGIILMCNTVIDFKNQHAARDLTGHFIQILNDYPINIFKLGSGISDDGSYIGCFVLRRDLDRPIDRLDYGEVEANIKVQLSVLEGQFVME